MGENPFEGIKGFFFDLDGVLVQNGETITGAVETLNILRDKEIPFRILTNRTTRSRESLYKYLCERNFSVQKTEIFSAPQAAVHFLRHQENPKCCLVMREDAKRDFSEFIQTDKDPDFVIMGDIAESWNFPILNSIFNKLMKGARLVALHKGRFWKEQGELHMDIGVFVTGLEYITGKEALVMGKPSPDFFMMALEDINLASCEVAMLGDDIVSDIGGAQEIGIKGVLCLSGKYSREHDHHYDIKPDITLPSIAEIKNYI